MHAKQNLFDGAKLHIMQYTGTEQLY